MKINKGNSAEWTLKLQGMAGGYFIGGTHLQSHCQMHLQCPKTRRTGETRTLPKRGVGSLACQEDDAKASAASEPLSFAHEAKGWQGKLRLWINKILIWFSQGEEWQHPRPEARSLWPSGDLLRWALWRPEVLVAFVWQCQVGPWQQRWQGLSNPSPLLLGLAERAAEASKRIERGWEGRGHSVMGKWSFKVLFSCFRGTSVRFTDFQTTRVLWLRLGSWSWAVAGSPGRSSRRCEGFSLSHSRSQFPFTSPWGIQGYWDSRLSDHPSKVQKPTLAVKRLVWTKSRVWVGEADWHVWGVLSSTTLCSQHAVGSVEWVGYNRGLEDMDSGRCCCFHLLNIDPSHI